jgi:hypothetical protein
MLVNTNTAAADSPPDGPELARKLRRAMAELNGASEDANELVCVVEDSFGFDYPATDGERPTDAEQARAEAALPETLGSLARLENRMRRELWHVAKARRGLARMTRAGQGQR